MCMLVKAGNDELMTAEKYIKCYKKVWIHWENGKIYFSSDIQSFKYELGKTYSLRDDFDGEALNNFLSPKYETGDKKWLAVEEGFHSYVTLERAMKHYDDALPYVILECEIPKGSRYRIGTDTHLPDQDMYCSSMLSIVAWKFGEEDEWHRTDSMKDNAKNAKYISRMFKTRR